MSKSVIGALRKLKIPKNKSINYISVFEYIKRKEKVREESPGRIVVVDKYHHFRRFKLPLRCAHALILC
jgi:hypothetical protein